MTAFRRPKFRPRESEVIHPYSLRIPAEQRASGFWEAHIPSLAWRCEYRLLRVHLFGHALRMDKNLARLLEAQRGVGPTREQTEAKWATLGEDWHQLLRVCPTLYTLLRQWARTDCTLRAVAMCYGEAMREAVAKLLDFSPDMAATFRALWPTWRDPSPNCLGGETDDYFESLRFCGQVRGLYQEAFDMRMRREARRP